VRESRSAMCPTSEGICAVCGIPADAQAFDDTSVVLVSNQANPPSGTIALARGTEIVLARFALAPQYCGVLQYFAQFTNVQAADPARIQTPGLEWSIRANGHPLSPYLRMSAIINPWGYGSFPVALRLPEGTTIEFAVRCGAVGGLDDLTAIGGRIMGRYWYNAMYGDADWKHDQ